jgi:hypothetical protein
VGRKGFEAIFDQCSLWCIVAMAFQYAPPCGTPRLRGRSVRGSGISPKIPHVHLAVQTDAEQREKSGEGRPRL